MTAGRFWCLRVISLQRRRPRRTVSLPQAGMPPVGRNERKAGENPDGRPAAIGPPAPRPARGRTQVQPEIRTDLPASDLGRPQNFIVLDLRGRRIHQKPAGQRQYLFLVSRDPTLKRGMVSDEPNCARSSTKSVPFAGSASTMGAASSPNRSPARSDQAPPHLADAPLVDADTPVRTGIPAVLPVRYDALQMLANNVLERLRRQLGEGTKRLFRLGSGSGESMNRPRSAQCSTGR